MENKVRIRHGWKQYSDNVVSIWDDFISWDERSEGEKNFFIKILKKYCVKTVLDISCGTGYDSINLLKAGFIVKSCDGSERMLKIARENAFNYKVRLDAIQCDWRNLVENFKSQKFDAIICLGNSLTHLFSEKDRISVINQIYYLLNKGGILIIDQRNYDFLLDKSYKSKHKYVYCGKTINVEPLKKSENLLRMKYTKEDNGFFILDMYPIRLNEMLKLMANAGFSEIKTYGDFKENFDINNIDFIQHVAIKN